MPIRTASRRAAPERCGLFEFPSGGVLNDIPLEGADRASLVAFEAGGSQLAVVTGDIHDLRLGTGDELVSAPGTPGSGRFYGLAETLLGVPVEGLYKVKRRGRAAALDRVSRPLDGHDETCSLHPAGDRLAVADAHGVSVLPITGR